MTDGKKRRLSMLDNLTAAGAPAPAPNMLGTNRALRSARDAVDTHRIWDLDPMAIDDTRFKDRLDPTDVLDLRASIEMNGQTVPVLVRRHPSDPDRYLLVYGRRRLEAIRGSDKVTKVRALIASMDDGAAIRAQVSENTARRDLSYIERALFARELIESGFGNQSQVAEVLNVTKSAISMALSVADAIGPDLARAIGPAHGIGRPRWEALSVALTGSAIPRDELLAAAGAARDANPVDPELGTDPSADAFAAVMRLVSRRAASRGPIAQAKSRSLTLSGQTAGRIQRGPQGLKLDLHGPDDDFLDWLDAEAQGIFHELHARWQQRG